MSSRSNRTFERNKKIREDFAAYDLKKYKLDYVLEKIGEKFYLDATTIYLIIKKIGRYNK